MRCPLKAGLKCSGTEELKSSTPYPGCDQALARRVKPGLNPALTPLDGPTKPFCLNPNRLRVNPRGGDLWPE